MKPLLLLVHMPWFTPNPPHNMGYHGYSRIVTLLYKLKYACMIDNTKIKMIALVQPGGKEVEKCQELCGTYCKCEEAQHHRSMAHNTIAKYATGDHNLLYFHADMWINVKKWFLASKKHAMMSPKMGLQGSNYRNLMSYHPRCIDHRDLDSSKEWNWWMDSKNLCRNASKTLSNVLRYHSDHKCCYGWVDVVFVPARVHSEFREAANILHNIQVEVAIGTIFHAIEQSTNTPWKHVQCKGGSLIKVSWNTINRHTLCAHKVPIHEPLIKKNIVNHLAIECNSVKYKTNYTVII
jgi:hypothetical protein